MSPGKKPEVYLTAIFRGMTVGVILSSNEERKRGNEFKLLPNKFKLDGKILLAVKVL